MFQKKRILVNVVAWTDEIEEIKSCNVRIDKELTTNIISKNFASFLGCRMTSEEPKLAVFKNEPVKLLGKTNILIKLPKTKRRKGTFTIIECALAENPKSNIVLARTTQLILKIYPQPVIHPP